MSASNQLDGNQYNLSPASPNQRGAGATIRNTGPQQAADLTTKTTDADYTWRLTSSQAVRWWAVHEFIAPLLAPVGSWPMAGTPAWCALPDANPAKIAALYSAAEHWALRVETCQQAECDASRDVSAAVNWGAVGKRIQARNDWYMSHPWMRRVI
jgi:hypothetical protein